MFYEEAIWIKDTIKCLDLSKQSKILDLGSSTLRYRTVEQPYIDKIIFKPLKQKGFSITYADIKKAKGVDICIDIEKKLELPIKFNLLICASLLEHIKDRKTAIKNIIRLVTKNGFLIVTVPYVYRYHEDPIDTMFRPSNKELEHLFSKQKIIKSKILSFKYEDKPTKISAVLLQKVK
jgi:SAM-dependent methyltransferase